MLVPGHLKLCVQRSQRKKWRRPQLELTLPEVDSASGAESVDWIEYAHHPLSEQDYVNLIQTADIGLLLYDSRTYYARRAGVLGEFLACGIPVVVPAACWLADQVERENRRYWRRLFADALPLGDESGPTPFPAVQKVTVQKVTVQNVTVRNASTAVICRLAVEPPKADLRHLVVGWQPLSGETPEASRALDRWSATIDERGEAWCLLPVSTTDPTVPCRLSFRWAFADETVSLREVELRSIAREEHPEIPWGEIGLVATDIDQIPSLVAHLHRQYPHFLAASQRHASRWFADHDPRKTINCLLPSETSAAPTAKASRAA